MRYVIYKKTDGIANGYFCGFDERPMFTSRMAYSERMKIYNIYEDAERDANELQQEDVSENVANSYFVTEI